MNRNTDETESLPNSLSLGFVEALYADYLRNPASVSSEWRDYFQRFFKEDEAPPSFDSPFQRWSIFNPPDGAVPHAKDNLAALQNRVDLLIRNYRVRGHLIASIDPLNSPRPRLAELEPEFYGFTAADMERLFSSETLHSDKPLMLRDIIECMRHAYCQSVGAQFMHIDDLSVRRWLQERIERPPNPIRLSREEQLRILTRLTDAAVFEEFIRRKYLGAKTFSLEGAESLIPLLELAIDKAGEEGIQEIVIGMAHRGRLNVLANIIGKSPQEIFWEFEDRAPETYLGHDDVKYHLGYSNDWVSASGRKIHLSLCFNPSHLEFVNPVALGRLRAKQDRVQDAARERGIVLLIHGDAAFAGEGVIQETLNLSELEAYTTGGALHVVINNQIGFTTPPAEARSSSYATDVAKMLQIPIFHVNGEDPEAVAQVVRLAMDFRNRFKRDAVIDMYGYRRHGHNEGDEPSFTQPLLYREINRRKSVREGYLDHLLTLGEVTVEEAENIAAERRQRLAAALSQARRAEYVPTPHSPRGVWAGYRGGSEKEVEEVETAVDQNRLSELLTAMTRLPPDFHPHPKIARSIRHRLEMARGERPLDWSAAEALAFATLASEGWRVRLSGQDSARGTFSHRHAVLHDVENGARYFPLQHVSPGQASVEIYNSPLSELAVLGFEYGYSLDWPDGLIAWEGQFGDFCNAAQVMIDQFIASAEDKWRRLSGLTLLLPHGFEGMGPEHSSARLERFLQLSAEDNIQVVYPTTPAQYFHCLRRQVLRRWRKPLIVMTPKSLLRHPRAVSRLEECGHGQFQRAIAGSEMKTAERVILCSGKIYYEIEERRRTRHLEHVAMVRLEQLYPLSGEYLEAILSRFSNETPVFWVQEEPQNMGAWHYLKTRFGERLFNRWPFSGVFRLPSASPATGSFNTHKREQGELLDRALGKA